jgi:hypothetical protein
MQLLFHFSEHPGSSFNAMVVQTGLTDREFDKKCLKAMKKLRLIDVSSAEDGHKQKQAWRLTEIGTELVRTVSRIRDSADALAKFKLAIRDSYAESSKSILLAQGWTKKEIDLFTDDFMDLVEADETVSRNFILILITTYLSTLTKNEANPLVQQIMVMSLTEALTKSTWLNLASDNPHHRQAALETLKDDTRAQIMEDLNETVIKSHLLRNRHVNGKVLEVLKSLYPLLELRPFEIAQLKETIPSEVDNIYSQDKYSMKELECYQILEGIASGTDSEKEECRNFMRQLEREKEQERILVNRLLKSFERKS